MPISKTNQDQPPSILDELADALPRFIPGWLRKLVILRIGYKMVQIGLMRNADAQRLRRDLNQMKSGRKLVNDVEASAGPLLDRATTGAIDNLLDYSFPSDGKAPGRAHYESLLSLALQRGIAKNEVDAYMCAMLDVETLTTFGLED